jgi:hypothetical protein
LVTNENPVKEWFDSAAGASSLGVRRSDLGNEDRVRVGSIAVVDRGKIDEHDEEHEEEYSGDADLYEEEEEEDAAKDKEVRGEITIV